jgi:dsRNA-specific ribonuclease
MDTTWKNSLQEYCQKHKISLPTYRIKNQSGPAHILKFQVFILMIRKMKNT